MNFHLVRSHFDFLLLFFCFLDTLIIEELCIIYIIILCLYSSQGNNLFATASFCRACYSTKYQQAEASAHCIITKRGRRQFLLSQKLFKSEIWTPCASELRCSWTEIQTSLLYVIVVYYVCTSSSREWLPEDRVFSGIPEVPWRNGQVGQQGHIWWLYLMIFQTGASCRRGAIRNLEKSSNNGKKNEGRPCSTCLQSIFRLIFLVLENRISGTRSGSLLCVRDSQLCCAIIYGLKSLHLD